MVQATSLADPKDLPRLITYFHIVPASHAIPIIKTLLEQHRDNEQIVLAALKALSKYSYYENLEQVRYFLTHPNSLIRAEAAAALGKFGTFREGQYLVKLLEDPNEIVQHRAAEALLNLPTMDELKLGQLQKLLEKAESRDMLTRVFAERRYRK